MLEHGAYTLLLDRYYATERPIAHDDAYRVCRARSKEERAAVDSVLGEFFLLTEGLLHNKRADEEIGRASHQREVNQEIGKRGGRPKRTEPITESVSEMEPINNPSQTPDTRHQTEIEPTALVAGTAYRPPPCPAAEIVELYRKRLPSLPGVDILNDSRKRALSARWREVCSDGKFDRTQGLDWFDWFFTHVGRSRFLTGQSGRKDWRADLDFLMTASKFPRVVEGVYHKDAA